MSGPLPPGRLAPQAQGRADARVEQDAGGFAQREARHPIARRVQHGERVLGQGKCQNSVLDRPTRGKPAEQWGLTPQIAPLYGHHSA